MVIYRRRQAVRRGRQAAQRRFRERPDASCSAASGLGGCNVTSFGHKRGMVVWSFRLSQRLCRVNASSSATSERGVGEMMLHTLDSFNYRQSTGSDGSGV